LPYPKGNRDEWITAKELERLSSVFTHSEAMNDKEQIQKSLGSLREYVKKFISPQQVAAMDKKAAMSKNTKGATQDKKGAV